MSIGIFDSGLGGLTVLKTLADKFPRESFCYLGDIARLPYGNKSPETIRKYGEQIIQFLLKKQVKAIIIACNSASTVFLNDTEAQGVPLLNVIVPGSVAALKVSQDKRIAVLGTAATIRSHAYRKTLESLDQQVEVLEEACPLFVPLVEEGMVNDTITQDVARRYLARLMSEKYQTIILGCTHYPMLKNDLLQVLGSNMSLIESGEVLAENIDTLMSLNKIPRSTEGQRQIQVYITDLTDHFERLAHEFISPVKIDHLERVVL